LTAEVYVVKNTLSKTIEMVEVSERKCNRSDWINASVVTNVQKLVPKQ